MQIGNADEDALLRAKRLVAQRCLYGVDKNPLAVNLAKLSLWLETMAKDEPFTFVDHALRTGDSLVGLDLDQIRRFDWSTNAAQQLELALGRDVDIAVSEALKLRERILELARTPGARATEEKESLLKETEDALERARLIGDLVVGAWFGAATDKDREKERHRRHQLVLTWLRDGGSAPEQLTALASAQRKAIRPFHWMLEFPEIFVARRQDPLDEGRANGGAWFDSFVGNPPFSGKNGIADLHAAYPAWLQQLHQGAHGNADLCAHFFRRANLLLGEHGTAGLVATNTIAQGDTRGTGLQPMLNEGTVIYDAVKSMPWPGEAAVAVSLVHTAKGRLAHVPGLQTTLDGLPVNQINSRLLAGMERPDPRPLAANEGLCFQGSIVLGMGFTLTPEERKDLIRRDSRNGKLIFPYLGGEEVNTSPTQTFHRYVINFGEMTLEEAKGWPDLLSIVQHNVKPERDRLADNPDGRRRKTFWWQFGRSTPALNVELRRSERCLVNSQVSKHLVFAWQPTDRIFSHALYVMAFETDAHFAVLQSRVHEVWARLLSSSLEDRLRYAASDCFDTFPFPVPDPAATARLSAVGKRLYEVRAKLMVDREQGLTTTYNQLKDPAVQDSAIRALRKLHEEMDRIVLAAYGWEDLEVPVFTTPSTAGERAASERFGAAVIDRLFALNAERADAEAAAVRSQPVPVPTRKPPQRAKFEPPASKRKKVS